VSKGENQECLFEGLIAIFEHIGGVPPKIWFDNTKTIVTKVLKEANVHLRTILSDSASITGLKPSSAMSKPVMKKAMWKARWAITAATG